MDNKDIKKRIGEGQIYIRAIIEVVGKPKEHVKETLDAHIKHIDENKDITLIKKNIEPPIKQKEFFSAFAEIEILCKKSNTVVTFCFDYMPSSVEIMAPERLVMSNSNFSNFLNDMQARLHAVNTGVIQLKEQNKFFIKNTAVLLRNFIVVLLSSKPMTIEKMHPYLGVKKEDILKILDVLIKEGKVIKKDNLYAVKPK
jgi:hypothetical protein